MDENKLWAVFWVCCMLASIAGFGTIAFGVSNSNAHFYRTAEACIQKGGTWIPGRHGSCIPR